MVDQSLACAPIDTVASRATVKAASSFFTVFYSSEWFELRGIRLCLCQALPGAIYGLAWFLSAGRRPAARAKLTKTKKSGS
jgi:hypothetical protein